LIFIDATRKNQLPGQWAMMDVNRDWRAEIIDEHLSGVPLDLRREAVGCTQGPVPQDGESDCKNHTRTEQQVSPCASAECECSGKDSNRRASTQRRPEI